MPWFLLLLAAGLAFAVAWRSSRWLPGLLVVAVLAGLSFVTWPGRFTAEKMLTDLAMPAGAIWFLLVLTAGWSIVTRRWKLAAWGMLLALGLSIAANHSVASTLVKSLEWPLRNVNALDSGEFDAVILLGGGAGIDHTGRPQLNSSGDRVVVASRLYRAGRTKILVCTGDDVRPAENLPTAAGMSVSVLVDLGIPRDSLLIAGGENTKTELAAVRKLIDEQGWKRVGIVTSAWHMPRVERLAQGAGVEFVPLPADFRTVTSGNLPAWDEFRRFSLIPSAGALDTTHLMAKEYLAWLVGR